MRHGSAPLTLEWIASIAATDHEGGPVLFEGQMRLTFLREALRMSVENLFSVVRHFRVKRP